MPPKPDSFSSSVWLRPPRTQTGQPGLSREQIVRTAIEILDAEGAAGLSMRRLGSKLGSGATSLYWHVAHKDELMELAVDEVLGELSVPEPGGTTWRRGASVYATGMRATLLRHPWAISRLGMHPTLGPNALCLRERLAVLLQEAGFTGEGLSHASALLTAHAIGAATTESAFAAGTKRAGADYAGMVRELEPCPERRSGDRPVPDQWRKENMLLSQHPERAVDEAFVFGLERVLDGLEMWLSAHRKDGPAAG